MQCTAWNFDYEKGNIEMFWNVNDFLCNSFFSKEAYFHLVLFSGLTLPLFLTSLLAQDHILNM